MIKKLILSAVLLFAVIAAHAELKDYPIFDYSGGLNTDDQPERIADKYTPDCQNVLFDRETGPIKRNGYLSFLQNALTEKQPIRRMYEYRTTADVRYIVFNSSWSVYYSQSNGIPVSILTGEDPTNTDNYTTGLGFLLRDNGVTSGKWDGTTYTPYTLANSTFMVYGKYNVYYKDHWFKAGVSGYSSVLYWSVVADPGDFGSDGSGAKFVGMDDGDIITGLWPTPSGLMVFKRYATYMLVGSDPNTWLLQPISNSIGCLYSSTLANYQNYPMFLSYRGIELYDGVNFNLVSYPINNMIRGLNQLNINQLGWGQTTAADWGAGTMVNVDTTTNLGSASAITSLKTNDTTGLGQELSQWRISTIGSVNGYARQLFYPTRDSNFASVYLKWSAFATLPSTTIDLEVSLRDTSMNIITSSINYRTSLTPGLNTKYTTVYLSTTAVLTQNTSYYIVINFSPDVSVLYANLYYQNVSKYGSTVYGSYLVGQSTSADGTNWKGVETAAPLSCKLVLGNSLKSSYTTQSKLATNWGTWGTFSYNETRPAGNTVDYYVITSTSLENLSTNSSMPITNGASITSAVGPYIIVVASITRASLSESVLMNDIGITWYATTGNDPCAASYRDGYWLAVSTDSNTAINNVIINYDRNGQFSLFNNIYMASSCIFYNGLYTGTSNSAGQIMKQDIEGLYADNGSAYDSYYTTKLIDCGLPGNEKAFNYLYAFADNSGAWNMYCQYRLNGEDGAWTSMDDIDLNKSTKIFQKLKFSDNTRGNYIQFKFGNNTANQNFSTRGLNLVYDPYPVQ